MEEGKWLRTGSTAEWLQSVGCGGGFDPVEVNGVGGDMEEGALNDGRRVPHADAAQLHHTRAGEAALRPGFPLPLSHRLLLELEQRHPADIVDDLQSRTPLVAEVQPVFAQV